MGILETQSERSMSITSATAQKVCVIIGGGIVGASSAYFLKELGYDSIIVEQKGIACHSSGKAGGFLALDWQDANTGMQPIGKAAFALHKELAETFGENKLGFRHMKCLGLGSGEERIQDKRSWVDKVSGRCRLMGNETSLAQVHPRLLTNQLVESSGATVVIDKVVRVCLNSSKDQVESVVTESGKQIKCDSLLVAMGPWSQKSIEWFPKLSTVLSNTVGLKYTSILLDEVLDNTAVFLDSDNHVEIYPRCNETYICGSPSDEELPDNPDEIVPVEEDIRIIEREAHALSSRLSKAKTKHRQACFLPTSADGNPVLGRVPDVGNAFVACGLGCWGILNGPVCGKAMSQLIAKGHASYIDISPFSPDRPLLP